MKNLYVTEILRIRGIMATWLFRSHSPPMHLDTVRITIYGVSLDLSRGFGLQGPNSKPFTTRLANPSTSIIHHELSATSKLPNHCDVLGSVNTSVHHSIPGCRIIPCTEETTQLCVKLRVWTKAAVSACKSM